MPLPPVTSLHAVSVISSLVHFLICTWHSPNTHALISYWANVLIDGGTDQGSKTSIRWNTTVCTVQLFPFPIFFVVKPSIIQLCKQWSISVIEKMPSWCCLGSRSAVILLSWKPGLENCLAYWCCIVFWNLLTKVGLGRTDVKWRGNMS